MTRVTFVGAEFSVQFAPRNFWIASMVISNPFQLFIRMGVGMFWERFMGFIEQRFFCPIKLFVPSKKRRFRDMISSTETVWNFFCKFRSSMIIDAAWLRFLLLSRCLFNSKNKLVCQERPENLGVYLLLIFQLLIFQLLLLYQHSIRVHDFQLATNFSPVSDWHCPLFSYLESSQI